MKRRFRIALALFVCLLAGCLCAAAEGKKTEGDRCGMLELSQGFFSQNPYTAANEVPLRIKITKGTESEYAVQADVSFLDGDEALKGLYSWDPSRPDSLIITVPPEGTEGEARFRIRIETEHFYKEKELTARVLIFDQVPDTSPILIRAQAGRPIDLSTELIKRCPEIQHVVAIPSWEPAPDCENPDFTDEGEFFTPAEEGEYRMIADLQLGFAGVNIRIPMIIYTGESVSAESMQWLTAQAESMGTGSAETAVSAETGDQPFDDHGLSGYWTTSSCLQDGKPVDTRKQVTIDMILRENGKGLEFTKEKGDTTGLALFWKVTEEGIEIDAGTAGRKLYVLNGDGTISIDSGKKTVTLARQDWPPELKEKSGVKAEDLTGKWVYAAVDIAGEGLLPMPMLKQTAPSYLAIDENGVMDFFTQMNGKTAIILFNLTDQDGKVQASQLGSTAAPIDIHFYENNWLEVSLFQQRVFFVREDFWNFSIAAKDGAKTAMAGKSVTFEAEYEQPDRVKETDSWINWKVRRADGGDAADVASIDKKGVLKIDRDLQEKVVLEVTAQSAGYTTASCLIEAVPALKKLMLTPDRAVMYLGETEPLTVRASAEPAAAMPAEPVWKITGKGAELEAADDGTARITAVQAGKATVQVKDPAGGKTAKMTVEVLEPVTAVEIIGPETVKAGKTAAYKAALTPAKPGDRTVIWSVDTDESIATVNKNGQLKVSKNAPSGTVITLTAQAQGSPKEVLAALKITVE